MENDKAEPIHLERRTHPRFQLELPVEYRRAKDSKIRPGHTVNFSEDGLMVSVSGQVEIGEQLEIKIYFSSDSSLITIEANVKVAWVDMEAKEDGHYRFGVSFMNISPVDRERLNRFLSMYADPNQASGELKSPSADRFNPSKSSAPRAPEPAAHGKLSTVDSNQEASDSRRAANGIQSGPTYSRLTG
jgi:hypothetical protein